MHNVRHSETYVAPYNVGVSSHTNSHIYSSSRIESIGLVWFQSYNTFMGCRGLGTCYMLTIIYIYFNL